MSRETWTLDKIPLSQHEARPSGIILVDFHDGRGEHEVAHTRQCCHCNKHFISIKGSGHIRGFCYKCTAITCGDRRCDVCAPWERQLEAIESNRIILPGQW